MYQMVPDCYSRPRMRGVLDPPAAQRKKSDGNLAVCSWMAFALPSLLRNAQRVRFASLIYRLCVEPEALAVLVIYLLAPRAQLIKQNKKLGAPVDELCKRSRI